MSEVKMDKNFVVGGVEHEVSCSCLECYRGYPMKCACGKGFIHAQFLKENWQWEIELAFSCDSCGSDYKFMEFKGGKPKKFKKNFYKR